MNRKGIGCRLMEFLKTIKREPNETMNSINYKIHFLKISRRIEVVVAK
jgi:hypothetical protein